MVEVMEVVAGKAEEREEEEEVVGGAAPPCSAGLVCMGFGCARVPKDTFNVASFWSLFSFVCQI